MEELQVYNDGRWRGAEATTSSSLAHSLHYGTGVFEGIRSYQTPQGPRIFRLDAHLERLRKGAGLLGFEPDTDELARACREALERNRLGDAYLRPIVFAGSGPLTLDLGAQTVSTVVAALPWSSHLGDRATREGIRLTVSPLRRNSAASIPPLKLTGAYVNSVLAKREAGRRGFDEALFVDGEGFVCEATGENVFAVFGDEVVAVDHPDALPGITREAILDLAARGTSRPVSLSELLTADEIFVTGTSAEVTPVTAIDDRAFPLGVVTRCLQASYGRLVRRSS